MQTTSGTTYTLSEDQYNWVIDRYKKDQAGSYGYDDADKAAQAAGQMSAKVRSSYKNSNVDNALMELGLPSEANLGKYLAAYDSWHTGGIKDVIVDNIPQDAMDWVGTRFRGSWQYAATDEDQQRKAQGLIPSALLSGYSDTELDDDLMRNGLPSAKNLTKYLESYDKWHTGKMSDVFGSAGLPDDYWSLTKNFFQNDFEYENTPEDQERKKQGLVPTKLLKEYEDTEIDEELLARGLPPMKRFADYADRYNQYSGIESLYANVALAQTKLKAQGINNDNQRHDVDGKSYSGKDLYAKAFFDELERTDEAGNYVYSGIMPLFIDNHVVSGDEGIDPTEDYVKERGKLIKAAGKAAANAGDFDNYKAFSYDDFMSNASGYYDKYIKDIPLENGQTIGEYMGVLERDSNEEAVKDLYDIDDSLFSGKGVREFVNQYHTDYPNATPKDMFIDMIEHGVDDRIIRKSVKYLQSNTTKNADFYGISDAYVQAKKEAAARAEAKNPSYSIAEAAGSGSTPTEDAGQTASPQPNAKDVQKAIVQFKSAEEGRSYSYEYNPSAKSAADRQYEKAKANLMALGFDSVEAAQAWLSENEGQKAEQAPAYTDAVDMVRSYLNEHGEWTPENMAAAFQYLREQGVPEDAVQGAAEFMQQHYGNLPVAGKGTAEPLVTADSVSRSISDFANTHGDTRRGEWTEENATALFKSLEEGGAKPSVIKSVIEDDATLWQLAEHYDKYFHSESKSNPGRWEDEQSKSLNEYIDAAIKADGEDEATISDTKFAIQNGLSRLIDESEETGNPVSVDDVLAVIDSVRQSDFTNPTAIQKALQDLGFSEFGVFSGLAYDLMQNWDTDSQVRMRLNLGGYRTVDVAPEDQVSDIDRIIKGTVGDFWASGTVVAPQKVVNDYKFSYALRWSQEKIADGELTAGEAYNILAANGYQDEMETYMPEEWHEAHFKENLAPTLWAQSGEENAMLWEDMTQEERSAVTDDMWNKLTLEKKESIYGNPNWWKQDPTVYRTFGQALEQQFQMVLPSFAANLITTPVVVADAIDAAITGRPEMKESTEKWRNLERGLSQYGYVEDSVNGAKVAQVASDVTQELLRMETLGTVGGSVGAVMGSTAAGAALARAASGNIPVVKTVANMFLKTATASPFVISSFAGNYADAKELGASNSEAAWFGALTGLTEGILESFEFDELWGRAIGQDGFAKQLLAGKTTFLQRLGIVGKARLASMAASGAGEFTEETIGYGLETFLKMRHDDTWGKGTEWSVSDWLKQAMMGFITGAVGGGISSAGSITAYKLVSDYMQTKNPLSRQAFPDNYTAVSIADSLPDGVVDTYRKGGAKILSVDAYRGVVSQIANCDAGIENAAKVLEQTKAAEKSKLDAKLLEIEKNRARAAGIDTTNTESISEFANLCNKLGIKVDLNAGDIAGQVQAALDARASEAQRVYDTDIADAEAACKTRQQEAQNQKASLQKQIQEHYVGLYLLNHDGIVNGLSDEVAANTAMAWQNGAKYDPSASKPLSEQAAEGAELVRKGANDLVRQYGAIEPGRNPRARDVEVPKQTNDQNRVSQWIRSLVESGKLTDDQAQNVLQMVVDQDYGTYIPTSQEERMKEAQAYIAERQPLQAQQEFHDMVMNGKFGVKTNAIGIQLLSDAAARGDIASVLDIAADLQLAATEAGQSAQIFNVLKELKGVGSAWYMQKVIDRMNSKYADEIRSGKMQKIAVDPALMANLAKATTVDQMAAAEEAVAKDIARQLPLTWDDRLSSWRYFSMLANPTTHIRNITGNLLMKGLNTAKDAVATGLENVLGVDQSERAHALLTAADKSTWGNWAQQSYEEQAKNLRGGGKLGFETFIKQNMRSFDTKWLNALAKFNFNALEGEDVAFIKPAYKNALMQYMKAQGYELKNGVAGKTDAKGQFNEITKAQMNEAIEWASEQAWKATFRDASSLATMLNKISKENAVSRLLVEGVMPFKKTPINIAKRGVEFSPAGIIMGISQLTNGVKKGKVTTAQAIDTLSSGITGTALMALGVMLAKMGVIRAGGEKDKKLEGFLEDTGDQTYSFKFGNISINMSSIAPATIPLFMGVALNEMIEQGGDSIDLSTITDTIAGTLNPFMEMSFMSSLNSALKNYNNNGIGGALGNTLLTAAENYGSQFLPTIGGKVAQFLDPTQRTTKSDITSPVGSNLDYYGRSLAKKVPGLEATLQPDVDVWGRTNTKDSFGDWLLDFANKFVLPTNVKVTNRDAVDNELIRLVESTGVTDFLPSDGSKYFTVKKQPYKMNAKQYQQYSQERGQAAYVAMKDVMASAAYQAASDERKAELLKKAKEAAYKQVNNAWKEKLGAYDN